MRYDYLAEFWFYTEWGSNSIYLWLIYETSPNPANCYTMKCIKTTHNIGLQQGQKLGRSNEDRTYHSVVFGSGEYQLNEPSLLSHKVRSIGNPVRIEHTGNHLLNLVWHKDRTMGHPVRT